MVDRYDKAPHWQNVTHWTEIAEVDLRMIYLCLNRFDQENLANPNPYDLRLNTITKNSVNVKEEITTPPIYIQIQWKLIGVPFSMLGSRETLWVQIQNATIEVMVVQVFDYKIRITIPVETLTFDLKKGIAI